MFLLHPSHILCEEAKKKSCIALSSLRFPNSIGNLRESWYLGRNASGAPELWLCTVRLFTFPLRSNYGCSLETHESWPATKREVVASIAIMATWEVVVGWQAVACI
jgi:hypothetical protein